MKILLLITLFAISFAAGTMNPVSQELRKLSEEKKTVMESYRLQIEELKAVPFSTEQIKALYAEMKSEITGINNKQKELIKSQGITIRDIKESPKYIEMEKRKTNSIGGQK